MYSRICHIIHIIQILKEILYQSRVRQHTIGKQLHACPQQKARTPYQFYFPKVRDGTIELFVWHFENHGTWPCLSTLRRVGRRRCIAVPLRRDCSTNSPTMAVLQYREMQLEWLAPREELLETLGGKGTRHIHSSSIEIPRHKVWQARILGAAASTRPLPHVYTWFWSIVSRQHSR